LTPVPLILNAIDEINGNEFMKNVPKKSAALTILLVLITLLSTYWADRNAYLYIHGSPILIALIAPGFFVASIFAKEGEIPFFLIAGAFQFFYCALLMWLLLKFIAFRK
jgi:hypothetical protein